MPYHPLTPALKVHYNGVSITIAPIPFPLSPQPCSVKSECITGAAVKITLPSLVLQVKVMWDFFFFPLAKCSSGLVAQVLPHPSVQICSVLI